MKKTALAILFFAFGCWIGNRVGYDSGYDDGMHGREAEFDAIDEEWLTEQRRLKREQAKADARSQP